MKAKQIFFLVIVTLGILFENVNTSPIFDDNFNLMVIQINVGVGGGQVVKKAKNLSA